MTSKCATIAMTTLATIAIGRSGGFAVIRARIQPGALTLTLASSFLTFLRLPPDWQIGAQGAILIAVLAIRLLLDRWERQA